MDFTINPLQTGTLTLREYATEEDLPLSTIHEAVFDFLQGREDVVVFGAQAVNAYVGNPRMTQNVDLMALNAEALAETMRAYLHQRFHIAVRIRAVGQKRGFRLYQARLRGNRHLVDIRSVDHLPPTQNVSQLLVPEPATLIAQKLIAYQRRRGKPKAGTDWRDLALLLLAFPELKVEYGLVSEQLLAQGASDDIMEIWRETVKAPIEPDEEEDEFWE